MPFNKSHRQNSKPVKLSVRASEVPFWKLASLASCMEHPTNSRRRFEYAADPQEVCAHGRAEASTSVCVPATVDEVRNNQTKPGHTVTTKKPNSSTLSGKPVFFIFKENLSCTSYMLLYNLVFSIVLQSLSHVYICPVLCMVLFTQTTLIIL